MRKMLWIVVGLVAVSSVSMIEPEAQLDLRWADQIDLDGDGDMEDIHLIRLERKHGAFLLTVDGSSVADRLSNEINGFVVVDVDTSDQYKEIAVHTPGPSDDDEYFYFWFNGESLHRVGQIGRWPHYAGDGILLVRSWMCFWEIRDKYVLTTEHKLKRVPQEFYWVGKEATVGKSVPIYSFCNSDQVQTHLAPGTKATIVLYKPGVSAVEIDEYMASRQYLVKSEDGQMGWIVTGRVYDSLTDLPMAD